MWRLGRVAKSIVAEVWGGFVQTIGGALAVAFMALMGAIATAAIIILKNQPEWVWAVCIGWLVTLAAIFAIRWMVARSVPAAKEELTEAQQLGLIHANLEAERWHKMVCVTDWDVRAGGLDHPEPFLEIAMRIFNGALWGIRLTGVSGRMQVDNRELAHSPEVTASSVLHRRGDAEMIMLRQPVSERTAETLRQAARDRRLVYVSLSHLVVEYDAIEIPHVGPRRIDMPPTRPVATHGWPQNTQG